MRIFTFAALLLFMSGCAAPVGHDTYHLSKTIAVPGDGSWDYLTVDDTARKVYISHNTEVDVIDADTGRFIGKVETSGAHGIALAPGIGHGFITNGKTNSVTVFDMQTLEPLAQIKTDKKPDGIVYEPVTGKLFAFSGDKSSATVIRARDNKRLGIMKLGGGPEFSVADGKGFVFVNLEDKNELLKIDARTQKVVKRWPTAPGESPSSMAIDRENRRLFIGCRSKILLVADADSGRIITSLPIGDHVDATAYDKENHLILSSNGDATLNVIRQDSPDSYHLVDTIKTRTGSKTFALDPRTHRLFVPAAQFGEPPAVATPDNPKRRPSVIPGTFSVLVYDK